MKYKTCSDSCPVKKIGACGTQVPSNCPLIGFQPKDFEYIRGKDLTDEFEEDLISFVDDKMKEGGIPRKKMLVALLKQAEKVAKGTKGIRAYTARLETTRILANLKD